MENTSQPDKATFMLSERVKSLSSQSLMTKVCILVLLRRNRRLNMHMNNIDFCKKNRNYSPHIIKISTYKKHKQKFNFIFLNKKTHS
jgi:hypothetical protein